MSFLLSLIKGYTGKDRLPPGGTGNGLGYFAGSILCSIIGGGRNCRKFNSNKATKNTQTGLNQNTNINWSDYNWGTIKTNNPEHQKIVQSCIEALKNPQYF